VRFGFGAVWDDVGAGVEESSAGATDDATDDGAAGDDAGDGGGVVVGLPVLLVQAVATSASPAIARRPLTNRTLLAV
jgi:hypothetical protein